MPPRPPLQPVRPIQAGEIVIYRDRNFRGPAVTISQDRPNLGLAWKVGSVRVHRGTWELCEGRNYQGRCLTVTSDNGNLGQRQVQSAKVTRAGNWRQFGAVDVNRAGWQRKVIRLRGSPRLWAVRLCAERNRVQIQGARVTFTNQRYETLHVPPQLAGGQCTGALALPARRNLASVEVTVSTGAAGARIRLEGH